MLSNVGFSKDFWAESINMAYYLVHRSLSTALKYKTHFEVLSNTLVDYSSLRVFGCPTYAHVNDDKLEPRAKKCILIKFHISLTLGILNLFTTTYILSPQRYAHANLVAFALSVVETIEDQEPSYYHEAVSSNNSIQWDVAMSEEIEFVQKNWTWELVESPKGYKIVDCKWVFKKKKGTPRVEAPRFKVQLLAKGYSQREDIDFNE